MIVFAQLRVRKHESIQFAHDPLAGLQAVIAIHSTAAGPALGGTRMRPYHSEAEAARDALDLSESMTVKAALHGLAYGGGKGVIMGDPCRDKSEELLRAYGRAVERLGGTYIASEDMGISSADLAVIGDETSHITTPPGTPGTVADPGYATAYGALAGIRASCEAACGSDVLAGRRIAIQGLGAVGGWLARLLAAEDADLVLADLDAGRAEEVAAATGARVIDPAEVLTAECDVLVPCAAGRMISRSATRQLRCRAIAGPANNLLVNPGIAPRLAARGITYAPEELVGSGGVIQEAGLRAGWSPREIVGRLDEIEPLVHQVFERAAREHLSTPEAMRALASERAGRVLTR